MMAPAVTHDVPHDVTHDVAHDVPHDVADDVTHDAAEKEGRMVSMIVTLECLFCHFNAFEKLNLLIALLSG